MADETREGRCYGDRHRTAAISQSSSTRPLRVTPRSHTTVSTPHPKSPTAIAFFLAAFAALFGGLGLAVVIGDHFIFDDPEQYRRIGSWGFVALVPIVWAALTTQRMKQELRNRYPTWWVRQLIALPASVAIGAGLLVLAPLGWIAAFTVEYGKPTGPLDARISHVDVYRPSGKGCDQRGELLLRGQISRICFDGLAELPMNPNQPVVVTGRQSSFGIVLEAIAHE